MKTTDYKILMAESVEALRSEVLAGTAEGWEVYGGPMLLQKPVRFLQCLVKKFDPHEGKVWVKEPGIPGQWVKPGPVSGVVV